MAPGSNWWLAAPSLRGDAYSGAMDEDKRASGQPPAAGGEAPQRAPSGAPSPSGWVPWTPLDALGVFLVTVALGVAVSMWLQTLAAAGVVRPGLVRGLAIPLTPALLGVVALLWIRARYAGQAWRLRGIARTRAGDLLSGLGVGVAAFALQIVLAATLQQVIDVPMEDVQEGLREAAHDPQLLPFLLLGAVVLAPLAEELFFRGMLHQALRDRMGRGVAMWASAALFAVVHVNLGAPLAANAVLFVTILMVGLLLAWNFERRRTIWAPIAAHAIFNGLVVAALLTAAAMGVG
jgi:uncharacterized protein